MNRRLIPNAGLRLFGGAGAAAASSSYTVVSDGLQAHYQYDQDFTDSANNYDGTGYGNPTWGDGLNHDSVDLDGSGDYMRAPTSFNPGTVGDFSISGWFYSRSYGINKRLLLHQKDGTGTGRTPFFVTAVGELRTALGGTSRYSGVNPSQDAWHHIVITYDSSAGTLQWYVDNTAKNSHSDGTIESCDGDILVGVNKSESGDYFNGLVDDLRYYDKCLSASEVSEIYNWGLYVTESLVSHYKFEETLNDDWGNYNLVSNSSPSYITGQIDSFATDWSANSGATAEGDFKNLDSAGVITICWWMRDSGTSADFSDDAMWTVVSDGDDYGGRTTTGGVPFLFTTGSDSSASGSTSVLDGTWNHVCFILDQSNSNLQLYINGSQEYSISYSDTVSNAVNSTLMLGNRTDKNDRQYDGDLDDLRFYSRKLSGSEVSRIANGNG